MLGFLVCRLNDCKRRRTPLAWLIAITAPAIFVMPS